MPTPQDRNRKQSRILPALIVAGISAYVIDTFGSPLYGALINIPSAFASLFLVMAVAALLSDMFWYLGNVYDRASAQTASGNKGTAGFVQFLDEILHDLLPDNVWGPYFGTFQGREIMADYGANVAVIGVSGGGKNIGFVSPNILGIHESKMIPDIKGELAATLARALRERGEIVHILNIGNVFPEELGETDFYNPLCIIAENFQRPGGLLDITDDVFEMCMMLLPEPAGQDQESNGSYFRDGSRDIIGFTIQMCVLINGHAATLGDVVAMLNERQSLLRHAQWAGGRLAAAGQQADAQNDGAVQ